MNIIIGTYLYCILALPIKHSVRDKLMGYELIYSTCKIVAKDQPTVPENEPMHVYMDCTKSAGWLNKGKEYKYKIKLKFWTRYEKETCYEEKP